MFLFLTRENGVCVCSFQTCGDFVKLAQEHGLRWQKLLQYEHEQRLYLEDMVEQLGKQHSNLEKQIRKSMNGAIGQAATDTAGLSQRLFCDAFVLCKHLRRRVLFV